MPQVRTASTDLPLSYRALLDTIAGSEAPDYNYIYGGKRFSDFSDHPRIFIPISSGPNRGNVSSAAGRYQFLGGKGRSWDEAKAALDLPDFSPQSQDKAAIWHAERLYRAKTGRELGGDLEAAGNDPNKLGQTLRPLSAWWTSLPGGIEHNSMTDSAPRRFAENVNFYTGNPAYVADYTPPTANAPNAPASSPVSTEAGSAPPTAGAALPLPRENFGAMLASMLPAPQAQRKPSRLSVTPGQGSQSLFGMA